LDAKGLLMITNFMVIYWPLNGLRL